MGMGTSMKIKGILYRNILILVLFGFFYAFIEAHIPFWIYIADPLYRIIYFMLFALISIAPILYHFDIFIFFGNLLLSTAVEDYSYWLITNKVPYSWSPYYITYNGYAVNDFIQLAVVLALYYIAYHRYKHHVFLFSKSVANEGSKKPPEHA